MGIKKEASSLKLHRRGLFNFVWNMTFTTLTWCHLAVAIIPSREHTITSRYLVKYRTSSLPLPMSSPPALFRELSHFVLYEFYSLTKCSQLRYQKQPTPRRIRVKTMAKFVAYTSAHKPCPCASQSCAPAAHQHQKPILTASCPLVCTKLSLIEPQIRTKYAPSSG